MATLHPTARPFPMSQGIGKCRLPVGNDDAMETRDQEYHGMVSGLLCRIGGAYFYLIFFGHPSRGSSLSNALFTWFGCMRGVHVSKSLGHMISSMQLLGGQGESSYHVIN